MKRAIMSKADEVFEFVSKFIEKNGGPPTYQEIADKFGISVSTAYGHVKRLQKHGRLAAPGGRMRAIEVPKSAICPRCKRTWKRKAGRPKPKGGAGQETPVNTGAARSPFFG